MAEEFLGETEASRRKPFGRVLFALQALLVVCVGFLAWREPAIDEMPPQQVQSESFLGALWEGITAQSHRPVPQALRTEIAGESAAAADANPRSI